MLGCLSIIARACVSLHFVPFTLHCISFHAQTWHHANIRIHSCILVTETPESELVEPTDTVEPEPGFEYMVEPEENQGKQLSMIFFPA
jgi:hypothetical protein